MRNLDDDSIDRLRHVAAATPGLPPTPDDRYRLVGELGRGGMGVVYLAFDEKLEREVALKVLRPDVSHPTLRARMIREAKILARLEHPGIVPIYDVGPLHDGQFHYAMKRVDGEPLAKHLEQHPSRNSRLRLFLRLCEPIAFAHAHGVIHRDLKPANVMVGSFGEVVVLDWGIAKAEPSESTTPAVREELPRGDAPAPNSDDDATEVGPARAGDDPGATGSGQVLGTPGYMAPEQLRGESHAAGPPSDVYALGVLLREIVADAEPGRDGRLDSIVARATAEEPRNRYESVVALRDDVSRYLDDRSVHAHREGPIEKTRRVLHRYRTPIILVATYLVVRAFVHYFGES